MDALDELLDEVVTCAKDIAEASEWGTFSHNAEKGLADAKEAIRAEFVALRARLEAANLENEMLRKIIKDHGIVV